MQSEATKLEVARVNEEIERTKIFIKNNMSKGDLVLKFTQQLRELYKELDALQKKSK